MYTIMSTLTWSEYMGERGRIDSQNPEVLTNIITQSNSCIPNLKWFLYGLTEISYSFSLS